MSVNRTILHMEVEQYLRQLLKEAGFNELLNDGSLYCGDSNTAIHPIEVTEEIIAMVKEYGE
jgi:hypothetical protein